MYHSVWLIGYKGIRFRRMLINRYGGKYLLFLPLYGQFCILLFGLPMDKMHYIMDQTLSRTAMVTAYWMHSIS